MVWRGEGERRKRSRAESVAFREERTGALLRAAGGKRERGALESGTLPLARLAYNTGPSVPPALDEKDEGWARARGERRRAPPGEQEFGEQGPCALLRAREKRASQVAAAPCEGRYATGAERFLARTHSGRSPLARR